MTKAEKAEYRAKRMVRLAEAQAIVAKGICPLCGAKLYRNTSLTGWWMCAHRGAVGFQKEVGPHCDFQTFYDPTPEEDAEIRRTKLSQVREAATKAATFLATHCIRTSAGWALVA